MDDCMWLEDISNSLHPRTERRRGRMFVCAFVHLLTALNHNCRVVMLLLLLQQNYTASSSSSLLLLQEVHLCEINSNPLCLAKLSGDLFISSLFSSL